MILQATFFGPRWVALELTADMNGYAVWDAAGSPVDQVNVMLTINAGVTVGSLSPGTPAIDATGSWAPGSRLTIVNAGNVYGAGGSGGAGGASTNGAGAQGSSGGDAIRLGLPTSIDNGNGYIFGGGGGGGGGGGANDG
ncbi:hypothetical protein FBR04_18305, partial [Betaproteobacteria bacterium PRO7]|nr:hypothetical protein [Betaproteobacteria bacterium PRO7]